ncbi:MAG TPA: hypothetical protein VF421_00250, partial [Niabella sp.]
SCKEGYFCLALVSKFIHMKKLTLKQVSLSNVELLTREQLKNIKGGGSNNGTCSNSGEFCDYANPCCSYGNTMHVYCGDNHICVWY